MADFYAKQVGGIFGGGGGGGGVTSLNTETGDIVLVPGTNITITPAGQNITISAASPTAGNLTDVGTDGIVIGNGSGAVLGTGTSIAQHVADTSHNGYLTSTDWNTFNGKQASGSYITALTGDVTATGPGSVASTLATVNGNVGSFTNASVTVNAKGLVTAAANGTAPVTAVSVATANGLAGSSSGGATPALTLSTTVSGVLKGNGTTISAAASGTDYAPATSGTSYLIGNGSGGFTNATSTGTGNNVLATSPTITTPTIAALPNLSTNGLVLASSGTGTLSSGPLTGDITTSALASTLATVNGNVGSFTSANITVNAKGLITAAANGSAGGPVISNPAITVTGFGTASATSFVDITNGKTYSLSGHFTVGTTTGVPASINLVGVTINTTLMGASIITIGRAYRTTSGTNVVPGASTGPFILYYDGSTNNKIFFSNSMTGNGIVQMLGTDSYGTGNLCYFEITNLVIN